MPCSRGLGQSLGFRPCQPADSTRAPNYLWKQGDVSAATDWGWWAGIRVCWATDSWAGEWSRVEWRGGDKPQLHMLAED